MEQPKQIYMKMGLCVRACARVCVCVGGGQSSAYEVVCVQFKQRSSVWLMLE